MSSDSDGVTGTRILIVRDELALSTAVTHELQRSGHFVVYTEDGVAGLSMAASGTYDVIVLSRMLPGGVDAVPMLRTLRLQGDTTPVLLVSSTADMDGPLEGFHAGADAVLATPFLPSELRLRVQVLARWQAERPRTRLRVADLDMDLRSRQVRRAGRRVALAPRELRFLECLMRHPGQVMTRSTLLKQVWGGNDGVRISAVRAYIARLRRKVDRPSAVPLIRTVGREGYVLQVKPGAMPWTLPTLTVGVVPALKGQHSEVACPFELLG